MKVKVLKLEYSNINSIYLKKIKGKIFDVIPIEKFPNILKLKNPICLKRLKVKFNILNLKDCEIIEEN